MESRGKGSSCLLSLSALVLPAVWMVLPSLPHVSGVHLSVFLLLFYIEAPGPVPSPHPCAAVNLSVVKNSAALLPASAAALFLIKCGGPSLPRTPLFLWEDSGSDRGVEAAWAPGCGTPGT